MAMNKDKQDIVGEEDRLWLAEHGYLVTAMDGPECLACTDLLEPVTLQDGEVLFEEGEPDDQLFIIHRGTVEMGQISNPRGWVNFGAYGSVYLEDTDVGTPVWLKRARLQEGDCAGELGFVVGAPHAMTARAKGEVQVYRLNAENIKTLAARSTSFCQCMDTALAKTQQKIAAAA
ncbi:MAG: cyclic nucleotide-binding domain-containing protein [Magnetococcales bacterium]|nr:cyclic nucleotide-binding domain-containing protein [Magnetococcales bacterium]